MKKGLYFIFLFISLFLISGCNNNQNVNHEHNFGSWQTLREKRCNEEGEDIRYCECGYFETRYTGFSDHKYKLDYSEEPNCYELGRRRYSCEFCGDFYEETFGETKHLYELTSSTNPSCNTDGVKNYSCKFCGDFYQEITPAPICTFRDVDIVEATCIEDGYIEKVCIDNPNHTYKETIPATGKHSIIYEKEDDKYHIQRCEHCWEGYICGLEHTFTEKIVGEGTCLSGAEIINECICGYKHTVGYIYEHNFENEICTLCYEHKPSEGLIYTLSGNSYIISGIGTCTDKHIYIPKKHLGLDVIGISIYAFRNGNFTDITIPNTIKYFGSYSFANCNNLETVYYNGSIRDWMDINIEETTSIFNTSSPMSYAEKIYFKENNEYFSPTTIKIPEDITEIKDFTFSYFNQVTEFAFHENVKKIGVGSFTGCDGITAIDLIGVEEISNAAFYDASKLANVIFDSNLKIIGPSAFYYCTSLDNVVIPEGTKEIYDGAFNYCSSLKNISIPDSIESFGHYVFEKCNQLEYYEIDGNLYLGNENNNKLVLVSLGNELLTKYEVGPSTKIILSSAFYNTPNITDLKIHENVILMEYNVLRYLNILERLELPLIKTSTYNTNTLSIYTSNLENLKYLKINKCDSLSSNSLEIAKNVEELILPNNIKEIGYNILAGFNNLKALTIPYISYTYDASPNDLDYLFNNNAPETLKNLKITNSLYISSYLLSQCNEFDTLILPDNLKRVSFTGYIDCTLPYTEYKNGMYLGSESNPYLLFIGLIDNEVTTLELHSDTNVIFTHLLSLSPDLEYTIFKDIKYMGSSDNLFEFAVERVNDVSSNIEIHDDTRVIYEDVISNHDSVIIPAGIEQIVISSVQAKIIDSLYYKGSLSDWMNLNFYNYSENPLVYSNNFYYFEDNDFVLLDELVIPSDITRINDYQFANSNISRLVIHENVDYIGKAAFYNCTNLQEVIINAKIDYLPKQVFENCTNLSILRLPNTIKDFDDAVFNETNINELYYEGDVNDWLEINFDSITSTPVRENTNVLFKNGETYERLDKLTVSGNVEIGDYQFYNFRDLSEVTFEFGVSSIGYNAFENTQIQNLYIPDSVTFIGSGAFKGCYLVEINLPFLGESIDDSENATIYHLFDINPTSTTDAYISIQKAIVRNGYIGDYAFFRCNQLKDVNIPDVTTIGNYAFAYCYYLNEFKLPKSLVNIGEYAFSDCYAFNNITLPKSLRYVGKDAFHNDWFENIYFEDVIKNWFYISFGSERANPKFSGENIYFLTDGIYQGVDEKFVIDDSITYIGNYQLVNFDEITEIYIHDNVDFIGKNFLQKCDNITKITTPFLGSSIDDTSDNSSIHYFYDIYLNFLEEISSITELVITKAKTIGNINGYGFNKLSNLKKIVLPNTLKACAMNPYFINDVIEEIHFNGTLEEYLKISFYCFRESTVSGNYLKLYLLDENNTEYLLTDLVIPTSIKTIKVTSFAGIELNDVTLHSGIEQINTLAFFNSKINNVYYEGNEKTWFDIEMEYTLSSPALFANALYFNYDGLYKTLDSIIVPDEVQHIGGHLAGMKQLKTLTIGENVNGLENAFVGCNSLDTIYFNKNLNRYMAMGFIGDVPQHYLYLLDDNNEYYQVTDLIVNTSVYSHFTSIIGLKTVTINEPNANNSIVLYNNAFSNCLDLESIIVNGTITLIEPGALVNNPNLKYNEYENGYYLGNEDDPYKVFIGPINKNVTSFIIYDDKANIY